MSINPSEVTKLLKEYVEWNFLSEKDLNRNTIEIFFDLKTAKRSTKKEQRVIIKFELDQR